MLVEFIRIFCAIEMAPTLRFSPRERNVGVYIAFVNMHIQLFMLLQTKPALLRLCPG